MSSAAVVIGALRVNIVNCCLANLTQLGESGFGIMSHLALIGGNDKNIIKNLYKGVAFTHEYDQSCIV